MRNDRVGNIKMRSPLREAMRVDPSKSGRRGKKKMVMALILTSLVDAFSIMLLYLLVQNTGNGSTLELTRAEQLPSAVSTDALNQGTLVRVTGDVYFINDQQVEKNDLANRLQLTQTSAQTSEKEALIIQADKSISFAMLAPVIRAGSLSGYHKFKFAVLQEEGRL